MERDRGTVEQLVNFLKEEIKHVNAFVILFNGQALNRSLAKIFNFLLLSRVQGSLMD